MALGAGGLAYGLTHEVIVGLVVAAAALWLLHTRAVPRPALRQRQNPPAEPSTSPGRPTELYVVCKRVGAERQEWASVKTGRIFEVLSQNGPPGAKPGDPGEVVSSAQGYRIVPKTRQRR